MLEKADDLNSLIYAEIDYCIENEGLEYLSDYYIRRSAKALFSVDDVERARDVTSDLNPLYSVWPQFTISYFAFNIEKPPFDDVHIRRALGLSIDRQKVAEVTFNGGGRREMRVIVNPNSLVRYKITINEIIESLRSSSVLQSVGSVDEGKRSYPVRTELISYTEEQAGQIVLRSDVSRDGSLTPLLLSDVATVKLVVEKRSSFIK